MTFIEQNYDEKAKTHYQKACLTNRNLNDLPSLYCEQGPYSMSELVADHAIYVWEKVYGPDDDRTIRLKNSDLFKKMRQTPYKHP
jgi:hypothetical protein